MRTFRISNSGSRAIAVRLSIYSRSLAPDGEELREEAGSDFVVFPARVVVDPGRSQVVRVQWRGGPVSSEQAYRLIAEQVPVDFQNAENGDANLNILFRYIASLYVVPESVEPNVKVTRARILESGSGGEEGEGAVLELELTNEGTRHVILNSLRVQVSQDAGATSAAAGPDSARADARTELSGEDLEGLNGINLLADARRRVRVPLEGNWETGPVQVSVDFDGVQ
jgi:fimbrial chaperone protein